MTTRTGFDIHRIGGRVGAEILGVDLSADLDPAVVAEIGSALLEHKTLVFRDPRLDDAGQLRFASLFGELTTAHPTVPSVDGRPHILPVDGDEGIRANQWHTDVTFVRTPPKASTLRAIVVPPHGGNTLVANAAAVYRDLPQPLRELAAPQRRRVSLGCPEERGGVARRLIVGHVEAEQAFTAAEQVLCQELCDVRLADARRSRDEHVEVFIHPGVRRELADHRAVDATAGRRPESRAARSTTRPSPASPRRCRVG